MVSFIIRADLPLSVYFIGSWAGSKTSPDAEEEKSLLPLPEIEPGLLCHPVPNFVSVGLLTGTD
jgi:hypothetical protein